MKFKVLNVFDLQKQVGVVGRTGAGKSSLLYAVLRANILNGSIVIDNIDTRAVSLQELRERITIIPQEPFLFSGTLRSNLDPLCQHTDAKLWKVLEEVRIT